MEDSGEEFAVVIDSRNMIAALETAVAAKHTT